MRVNLIYGAPCSGKSTYVRDNIQDGEAVYDFDALFKALTFKEEHRAETNDVRWVALDIRQGVVDACINQGIQTLWMICSWPTDRILTAVSACEAVETLVEASRAECYERLEADDTRPDKEAWRELIDKWFEEHSENRTKRSETVNKFWKWSNRVVNEAEGEATVRTLVLDGVIAAESWFEDDITPAMFKSELTGGAGPITVWINSPGGDCIAASQIYTMLMDYKDDVTVIIDGLAASAASVIAMAGTRVLMAPTAMMMIHNPSTVAFGDHKDMAKAIEMLGEVKESIINAYEIKTDLPRRDISKMMDAETWMNAERAVELGFADALLEDKKKRCGCGNESGYSFSASSVENAIMNKVRAKAPTKPAGRKVEDLFAELNSKKYI